ncbi:MAG: 4'-phosphopantetheinyl transferase superfamily protein [Bacteroidales bacterium]|nr:4'-phosphopantetheinyl transferase superfamily protein [Bacteroidales bacterium]
MPIIYKQEIEGHAVLGVWKISESVDELLSMIQFSEGERETFEKFKLKSRQAHWLSYRLAIRELLDEECPCEFFYDEHGKLHFANLDYSLSVTHSGVYSGVIISKKHYVGIDIEKLNDRINRLASKFLNAEEMELLPELEQDKFLTIVWSAKEALYKLYGKSEVQLDNISIKPFAIGNEGLIDGKLEIGSFKKDYQVQYHFSDDGEYILAFSVDDTIIIKEKAK